MLKLKNAEIGISTVALVILAVLMIAVVAWFAVGQVSPALASKWNEGQDWVMDMASGCENIPPIIVSRCAEGAASECNISRHYTDRSTYSIQIPITTEYWIDAEVEMDCSYADVNYNNPANPKNADWADNCSDNDPERFPPHEFQPLIYEFKIGPKYIGNYTFDPDLCKNPGERRYNISVYMGVINEGSYTLNWRILTPWAADDPSPGISHTCNPTPKIAGDSWPPCSDEEECTRIGNITSETIRVYCEGFR